MELKYYILDGQHQFEACKAIRDRAERKREAVPTWATKFNCRIVKTDTSLEDRQKIAGRQQARAGNVKMTTMSDNLTLFYKFVQKEKEVAAAQGRSPRFNPTQYLSETWIKSGKSAVRDGDVVC